MKNVLIAMSGGVDSTTAALILRDQGYSVAGATCKFFSFNGTGFEYDSAIDEREADDAKNAALRLGIEWQLLDMRRNFYECVLAPFARVYEQGGTPNPCIMCNSFLKFGALLDHALDHGYDSLATGHYARISFDGKRWRLKKALNEQKDQSYFLYGLTQRQLSHILFPLGNMSKEQTREAARNAGLANSEKKDSQDICFVPDGEYMPILSAITGKSYPAGNFVTRDGRVLGTHRGIVGYTVGQRRGLGLSLPAPMYVCDKRIDENEIVLCPNDELFSSSLTADNFNWICDMPDEPIRCEAKIRSTGKPVAATAAPTRDGVHVRVDFDDPQRAIARGQAVVLYSGDDVLGGGTIM